MIKYIKVVDHKVHKYKIVDLGNHSSAVAIRLQAQKVKLLIWSVSVDVIMRSYLVCVLITRPLVLANDVFWSTVLGTGRDLLSSK